MAAKFTSVQQDRINFLRNEWETIESFTETLECVESSTELHEFARQYNWDYGLEPLKLALTHPLCDRGTALEIYWLGQPDYYIGFKKINDVPSCNQEGYQFLEFIEFLLLEDRFQSNSIPIDPMASCSSDKRHYIAKYSNLPDELLLPNYGDAAANKERLKTYREATDDAKTLEYLSDKYLNSRDYIKALNSIERLIELDPESQRFWHKKISILKDIEKNHQTEHKNITESSISLPSAIHQVRQDLVECYQKKIELYKLNLESDKPSKFARKHIIEAQADMTEVYIRDKDYGNASEMLKVILEKVKDQPLTRIDPGRIAFKLAKSHQDSHNYNKALYYIDIYLEETSEFEYVYIHKFLILKEIGNLKAADHLLDQILETIDNTIEENRRNSRQEGAYFRQKSGLLEKYRQDFQGAADSLQKVIDLKLYYNCEDSRQELLSRIARLRNKSQNLQ